MKPPIEATMTDELSSRRGSAGDGGCGRAGECETGNGGGATFGGSRVKPDPRWAMDFGSGFRPDRVATCSSSDATRRRRSASSSDGDDIGEN